jgi:hypothetical protein
VTRLFELPATLAEVCNVLRTLPGVERARRAQGPRPVLDAIRRQARHAPRRGVVARRCLRRAIRWVDGCMIGGGNCYRRALLEIALDRGAAQAPLALGFARQDDRLTGHAWIAGHDAGAGRYDFTLHL